MRPDSVAVLTLHLIPEIGPRRMQRLIARFGSAAAALEAPLDDIRQVEDMTPALAGKISRARRDIDVEAELAAARKAGARVITFLDDAYPPPLRAMSDFPSVIYVRGACVPADMAGVALVGTRRATPYGRAVATRFGRSFAEAGVTTVSGLARGIDTEVHEATLRHGGRTIAVLGNGFLHHYPPENRSLEEKIAAQGALITEFPMNAFPDRPHFPLRNRIISGLTCATVVIEAGVKSGALITARYAADQGKDVFAVPGSVLSAWSAGPHALLKDGARPATDAEDVLETLRALGDLFAPPRRRKATAPAEPANPDEQRLLALIENEMDGVSIDILAQESGMLPGDLARLLLDMELKGLIRGLPGKMYLKA